MTNHFWCPYCDCVSQNLATEYQFSFIYQPPNWLTGSCFRISHFRNLCSYRSTWSQLSNFFLCLETLISVQKLCSKTLFGNCFQQLCSETSFINSVSVQKFCSVKVICLVTHVTEICWNGHCGLWCIHLLDCNTYFSITSLACASF